MRRTLSLFQVGLVLLAPVVLAPRAQAESFEYTLRWIPQGSATGFRAYVGPSSGRYSDVLDLGMGRLGGDGVRRDVLELERGRAHYIAMSALLHDGQGRVSAESELSNEIRLAAEVQRVANERVLREDLCADPGQAVQIWGAESPDADGGPDFGTRARCMAACRSWQTGCMQIAAAAHKCVATVEKSLDRQDSAYCQTLRDRGSRSSCLSDVRRTAQRTRAEVASAVNSARNTCRQEKARCDQYCRGF